MADDYDARLERGLRHRRCQHRLQPRAENPARAWRSGARRRAASETSFRRRLLATDPTGYVACCHAIVGVDTTARLKQIDVSTLIIAGELDQGAPVAMSQTMCEQIAGARLVVLKDASHLSAIEQPEAFAAAVEAFVARLA